MVTQKRRAGGVSDLNELIPQEHIEYFAKERGFPDPTELKKRLDFAFTASEIFREISSYPVRHAIKHLENLIKSLNKLVDQLEAEPFFNDLALRHVRFTREGLQSTLSEAQRSASETLQDVCKKNLLLTNANNAKTRTPSKEAAFLEELKRIHVELTGIDAWVTTDGAFDTSEADRYRGKFFDFAYACFIAANYDIKRGTLADRITELHKKLKEAKSENS